MTASAHVPVLLDRVVSLFAPAVADGDSRSGSGAPVIVDCTLGLGGHTEALLQAYPQIEVVGIDRDPHALQASRERLAGFGDRFVAVHAVYDELDQVLAAQGCEGRVAGVLMDLGVSSMQLDQGERGFAYAQDAPLDMRMDDSGGRTAADVLNTASVGELTRILREYGDERYASRIARAVVTEREREPFRTSGRLVELLYAQIPAPARRTGGHPAKRTFQALRIEVNDELQVLARALPQVVEALAVGGRAVIEAYQSGEDRLVKRAFTRVTTTDAPPDLPFVPEDQQPTHRAVIRGAEKADQAEIDQNPRAASVRLRAIERVRPTTTNTGVNR